MRIEEEYGRKTWWVLKQIQWNVLSSRGDPFIKYKIRDIEAPQDSLFPSKGEQVQILLELNRQKIICLGYETDGQSEGRFQARMKRKGIIFNDLSYPIPQSGILTFTVKSQKLDDTLNILDSRYGEGYRTYTTKEGVVITEEIKKTEFPWVSCNCGGFKINKESGEAFLYNTKTKFKPAGQEYKLLMLLLSDCGKRFTYDEIRDALGKKVGDQRDFGFILRNIRSKLSIIKGSDNKNIFETNNGYRINC